MFSVDIPQVEVWDVSPTQRFMLVSISSIWFRIVKSSSSIWSSLALYLSPSLLTQPAIRSKVFDFIPSVRLSTCDSSLYSSLPVRFQLFKVFQVFCSFVLSFLSFFSSTRLMIVSGIGSSCNV